MKTSQEIQNVITESDTAVEMRHGLVSESIKGDYGSQNFSKCFTAENPCIIAQYKSSLIKLQYILLSVILLWSTTSFGSYCKTNDDNLMSCDGCYQYSTVNDLNMCQTIKSSCASSMGNGIVDAKSRLIILAETVSGSGIGGTKGPGVIKQVSAFKDGGFVGAYWKNNSVYVDLYDNTGSLTKTIFIDSWTYDPNKHDTMSQGHSVVALNNGKFVVTFKGDPVYAMVFDRNGNLIKGKTVLHDFGMMNTIIGPMPAYTHDHFTEKVGENKFALAIKANGGMSHYSTSFSLFIFDDNFNKIASTSAGAAANNVPASEDDSFWLAERRDKEGIIVAHANYHCGSQSACGCIYSGGTCHVGVTIYDEKLQSTGLFYIGGKHYRFLQTVTQLANGNIALGLRYLVNPTSFGWSRGDTSEVRLYTMEGQLINEHQIGSLNSDSYVMALKDSGFIHIYKYGKKAQLYDNNGNTVGCPIDLGASFHNLEVDYNRNASIDRLADGNIVFAYPGSYEMSYGSSKSNGFVNVILSTCDIESYEACDDGNTRDGDGCSSKGEIETGWYCSGCQSQCEKCNCPSGVYCDQNKKCNGSCGDNIIQSWGKETCDDGNKTDGDGCSSSCQIESECTCPGTISNPVAGPCSCQSPPTISNDQSSATLTTHNNQHTSDKTLGTISVTDLDKDNTVTIGVKSVTITGGENISIPNLEDMLKFSKSTVIDNQNTSGTVDWSFNSGSEDFKSLEYGKSTTLTYIIEAKDSTGASATLNIEVTIKRTQCDSDSGCIRISEARPYCSDDNICYNDAPTFSGQQDYILDLNNNNQISGKLTVTDNNEPDTVFLFVKDVDDVNNNSGVSTSNLRRLLNPSVVPRLIDSRQTSGDYNWTLTIKDDGIISSEVKLVYQLEARDKNNASASYQLNFTIIPKDKPVATSSGTSDTSSTTLECSNNSDCSTGKTCTNNKCVEETTSLSIQSNTQTSSNATLSSTPDIVDDDNDTSSSNTQDLDSSSRSGESLDTESSSTSSTPSSDNFLLICTNLVHPLSDLKLTTDGNLEGCINKTDDKTISCTVKELGEFRGKMKVECSEPIKKCVTEQTLTNKQGKQSTVTRPNAGACYVVKTPGSDGVLMNCKNLVHPLSDLKLTTDGTIEGCITSKGNKTISCTVKEPGEFRGAMKIECSESIKKCVSEQTLTNKKGQKRTVTRANAAGCQISK